MNIKRFFLFFCCVLGLRESLGATITLKKSISLAWDNKSKEYWDFSMFSEKAPGILSKDVLSNGCSVIIYSKKNVLPPGKYEVIGDRKSSPDFWDARWHRTLDLKMNGGDEFSVDCQTRKGVFFNPINRKYISNVSKGYLVLQ